MGRRCPKELKKSSYDLLSYCTTYSTCETVLFFFFPIDVTSSRLGDGHVEGTQPTVKLHRSRFVLSVAVQWETAGVHVNCHGSPLTMHRPYLDYKFFLLFFIY